MSVWGAPKFTGGVPMEVDMERLQRTMQWLAIRKEAGLKLDPETAEVECCLRASPALLQAMYGSIFVACPKRSEASCGMFGMYCRTAVFRQHP
jgi:hypothetical protein